MKTTTWIVAALAAAIALTAAPVTHAAPASAAAEAAKAHAERGITLYNLADWTEAIREFRAAFEADPRPEYLFSKAQAERHRGDFAAAILSYKAFLRTSDASSSRVAATEELIRECEAGLAAAAQATARRDAEQEKNREDKARQSQSSGAPRTEAPPVKRSWAADPAGLILFIGGAAVGGTGAGVLFWGNSQMRGAPNQATYQQYEARVNEAKTHRLLGIVGMSAGAGLLAAGIIRFAVVASRSSSSPESIVADVVVSPTGVGVQGRF
jgi:tetratricopeptide (TPR) repeat protein